MSYIWSMKDGACPASMKSRKAQSSSIEFSQLRFLGGITTAKEIISQRMNAKYLELSSNFRSSRLPNGGASSLAPSLKGSQARVVLVVLAILAGQESYLLPHRLFLSSIGLL